jgi:phage terminase small subunit
MGHLSNSRHELFCQGLVKGLTQEAAYVSAGYRANRGGASRLATNVNILRRVGALKAVGGG